MINTVHILATCRNLALHQATRFVFQTLRIGFPDARVVVWGNKLPDKMKSVVRHHASEVGGIYLPIVNGTTHDAWIEKLVETEQEPFWICDTDMIFWSDIESITRPPALFTGRLEPAFEEEWTGTSKAARLHTCLMQFNPVAVRDAIRAWHRQFPKEPFTFKAELFRQRMIPRRGEKTLFYDTCAGLYHALGGTPFTPEQNECFDHFHCGTYADLITPHLTGVNLAVDYTAAIQQPDFKTIIQKQQQDYYDKRQETR